MARRINLALQGGGAHGAFTWGVLDRLLEDDTIEIAGISGTSAGALNGAAYKAGLLAGGREGAARRLLVRPCLCLAKGSEFRAQGLRFTVWEKAFGAQGLGPRA